MFEFRHLYCARAKLHAPFPFDGLLIMCCTSTSRNICILPRANAILATPVSLWEANLCC